jgi:hypothetical protein
MDSVALDAAIRAVCPIQGVSVGNPADKATWRIDYHPSATAAQKAAAQQVVDGWTDPLPTPPDISDRQFARGLWGDGIINYADFLGFIGPGTIPAPIQAIVDQLPDDDTGAPTPKKDAVGFLTGSKLYSFSHPLVEFFRQALVKDDPKWTEDYLRQQWLLWATL